MNTNFGWDLAWKSAMVLGLAGLITVSLRRSPAAARHLVWSLATAGSLALPLLALAIPAWTWAVLPLKGNPPPALQTGASRPPAVSPRIPRPIVPDQAINAAHVPSPAVAAPVVLRPASVSIARDPARWWLSAWSIVALTILVLPLSGRLGLRRLVRQARPLIEGDWPALTAEATARLGVRRRVTVLISRDALMPMTWGWLRPVILLPDEANAWPLDRRRDVLLHEMAHIRRSDALTQAIAQAACAVYWFNPLAWLAAGRMHVEREQACDDMVLVAGARPSDYALLLLEMARRLRSGRAAALAAVSMARPSHLEGRVLAILDPDQKRGQLGRPATILAAIGLVAILLPLSTLQLKAKAQQARGAAPVNASKSSTESKMIVTGRVLDPDGKPVKGAFVDLIGRPNVAWVGAEVDDERFALLGQGETNADGRFQVESTRTSSTRFFGIQALAAAPGFGLGWADLNPDAEHPVSDIKLRSEQAARVRLVDITGMPAAGVEVRVEGMMREGKDDDDADRFEGIYLSDNLPAGLRTWPGPLATDGDGRFLLTGIGRGLTVRLTTRDLRYARQTPEVKTTDKSTTIALEPARIIEGRVLAGDTGRTIPNAVIAAAARIQNEHANGYFTTRFQADAEGRFKINPLASDEYTLDAFPPAGEPYLIAHDELEWTKGSVTVRHDFKLRRGVVIQGKVTDAISGQPLAGSSVQFTPIGDRDNLLSGWQAIVASGTDGVFRIAVPPGKGHLLIFGPTSDYVLEATSEGMIFNGKPGGPRYYAHKVVPYEVKEQPDPVVADAALRPGKTVKIRVVGPEGPVARETFYLTALEVRATNPFWRGDSPNNVRDGRFELHGLDPAGTAHVDIVDPVHQWGASVDVSGKDADAEHLVTLAPCGQAKARFLDRDGKPVVNHIPNFEYIATPGPPAFNRDKKQKGQLSADAAWMINVDRKHYWNSPTTDAEGRITLPDLIPGALYRINDFSTVNDPAKGVQVRKDFTVKSGETLDLGDILIEKPRGN